MIPAVEIRPKRCRVCPAMFTPVRPMQVVCGLACARRVPVVARYAAKADRKARKEALKTRSEYIAEAQAIMNRYVRLRDLRAGYGCISCGERFAPKYGGAMDCGHFLSRGSAPQLRFNLHNMASQCVRENRYLGGSAGKFRKGLIERIGIAKVEALEANQSPAKFSIDYLKRLKRIFAKKARRMEKRLALHD